MNHCRQQPTLWMTLPVGPAFRQAPGMVSIPPSERLLELGGIATRGTLLRSCERVGLDRAVAAGDTVRIARGRCALAVVDEDARVAARIGGVLCLTSAALHHGWAVKTVPDRPHLMVSRGRHVHRRGARPTSIVPSWRRTRWSPRWLSPNE